MVTNLFPSTLGNYFDGAAVYLNSKGEETKIVKPPSKLSVYQGVMELLSEGGVYHSNACLPGVVVAKNNEKTDKIVLVEPLSYTAESKAENIFLRAINTLPDFALDYVGSKEWAIRLFMEGVISPQDIKTRSPLYKEVLKESQKITGSELVERCIDELRYEKATGLFSENFEDLAGTDVFIICGADGESRKYVQTLPNIGQIVESIPGSYHVPMIETPEVFNHVLIEMLKS